MAKKHIINRPEEPIVRQHIINRRKELMITQQSVATAAGIERSSYAAIERGLRKPSLEVAQRICMILNMQIDEAFPLIKNRRAL